MKVNSMIDAVELSELWEEVTDGVLRWLAQMACPKKPLGYFRFSAHAYHPWTLYGANSALSIYSELGLLTQLTTEQRAEWARMFLDHYHADLGLFLCPQLYGDKFCGDPQNFNDCLRADAAAPFKKVAGKLFELIGVVPPTPDEGTLGFSTFADLKSFFDAQRVVTHPYAFGSLIGDFFHKRTLWLRGQGKSVEDDSWIAQGYDYLEDVRDLYNGMMSGAGDDPVSQMNGLFKISCASYWAHQRPMPRARMVIDRVLLLGNADGGFGPYCEDYNATLLLCRLCRQEGGYRREAILQAITGPVLWRLRERRRVDGGFSFHVEHCLTQVNMYPVCDPLPESDLFGTGQQLSVLHELRLLKGINGDRPSSMV